MSIERGGKGASIKCIESILVKLDTVVLFVALVFQSPTSIEKRGKGASIELRLIEFGRYNV